MDITTRSHYKLIEAALFSSFTLFNKNIAKINRGDVARVRKST